MSRLPAEIQRLFSTAEAGCTRAIVLGLQAPADAGRLAGLVQSVQADLGWPMPALAVDGLSGLQVWWSLAQPLPLAEGRRLAVAIAQRWLADVPPDRRSAWPGPDGAQPSVPGGRTAEGRWSSFIAPDLAPVFSAEPWLDVPPSDTGQADLLAGLRGLSPADLAQAQAHLTHEPPQAAARAVATSTPAAPNAAASDIAAVASPAGDPRVFLTAVMNDATVPLALRIDAARALLAAAPR